MGFKSMCKPKKMLADFKTDSGLRLVILPEISETNAAYLGIIVQIKIKDERQSDINNSPITEAWKRLNLKRNTQ